MPVVFPMPAQEQAEYSRLFHHTNLDNALKILETQIVLGGDTHKHANFFASKKFKNKIFGVPDTRGVCLEFHWIGSQALLDAWPNDGEPINTVVPKPILYHIITQDPLNYNNWLIAERGYWQSIIYPGSMNLRFKGWTFDEPVPIHVKKTGLLAELAKWFGFGPKISPTQAKIAQFEKLALTLKNANQGGGAIFQT